MLKPIFYWKYSSPTFLGSFFAIFCDFRRVNVKISVFDPQKALPCPKRRLPVYFMKLSDKRCGLHPGSRTPPKKKMPSRMYMLGVCRKVTPYANVMKLGTVGLIGYVIALTAVGPHRLTGFGVTRHPSWVPAIDKAHRAYYSCSRYRGNAWSIFVYSYNCQTAVLGQIETYHIQYPTEQLE